MNIGDKVRVFSINDDRHCNKYLPFAGTIRGYDGRDEYYEIISDISPFPWYIKEHEMKRMRRVK